MAYSKYQIFLTVLMVISGTLVTLSAKLQDKEKGKYRNGIEYNFSHPFFQAVCMFLGEAMCFVVFEILYHCNKHKLNGGDVVEAGAGEVNVLALISGNRKFNPFIFLPASLCDMVASSLAYVGLNLTFASSFQMLNGAVMIFTGMLSVAFLGTKMQSYKWLGIFTVVAGLVVIGVSDFFYSSKSDNSDTNGIIAGDLFILVALIISSMQMVYEEKFIGKHNIPAMKAVGWEGIFGFTVLGTLLIPMYYIRLPAISKDDPDHRLENALDAFHQMGDNPVILAAVIVNTLAIGFLNFAGISVTKELSATTRVVLGNLRTILVWAITLALGWQDFHALQLLGFAFLIVGMCFYNNIVFAPLYHKYKNRNKQTIENFENPNRSTENIVNKSSEDA